MEILEDLNLENMYRRFLILALNKYKLKEHAAFALGISMRTMQRWINDFEVKKIDSGYYMIANKI